MPEATTFETSYTLWKKILQTLTPLVESPDIQVTFSPGDAEYDLQKKTLNALNRGALS